MVSVRARVCVCVSNSFNNFSGAGKSTLMSALAYRNMSEEFIDFKCKFA